MTITVTRNFAQGMGIGDYAAKRNMHRSLARRAESKGWADQRREHLSKALRFRAIVNTIQKAHPRLICEPGIYFAVSP